MLKDGSLTESFDKLQLNWNNMKINFTKNEYRLLLDMVEMAEWVLNAHRTDPSDEVKEYSEVYQKFFLMPRKWDLRILLLTTRI